MHVNYRYKIAVKGIKKGVTINNMNDLYSSISIVLSVFSAKLTNRDW
jgi:hypothetical protein